MTRRAATLALVAAVGLAAGLVTACTATPGPAPQPSLSPSDTGPRPVTPEEAELLALLRFRNFDAGARSVRATYTEAGHQVVLDGFVDYTAHTGYGTVSTDGAPTGSLLWDGTRVAVAPGTPTAVPGTPPSSVDGWTVAPLDPTAVPLSGLLAVLARLGADRPENPLLLRQGGALWLRADTVDGTAVTVFAGPSGTPVGADDDPDPDASGLRYWVDEQGTALRVEVRLTDTWATADLGDGHGVRIPALLQAVGTTG